MTEFRTSIASIETELKILLMSMSEKAADYSKCIGDLKRAEHVIARDPSLNPQD